MSERSRCWGIYRELAHSPGRETDDAEILRAAGRNLEALRFSVELKTTEEIAEAAESEVPPFIFAMCERPEALARLALWEKRGVRQVNSVGAIRNTYRDRTLSLFERDGIPFPRSVIVATGNSGLEGTSWGGPPSPCWVKRADVHNTMEGDVVFTEDAAGVKRALDGLSQRGVGRAVLQEHVPGDLIKFYGVGPASSEGSGDRWFKWFYHRDQRLSGHPFDPATLSTVAFRASASLGLEVFGGDAIATRGGEIYLIDLNAWPSFALYREDAAAGIASHLAVRFRNRVTIGAQE